MQVYIVPLMPRRSNDQGNNNWYRMCESKEKSRLQAARAWLQQLSSSPSSPVALTIPPPASNSSEAVTMSNNPMIQSPEDQFLYWRQDMEKKHEEQARQMKELQDHAELLQCKCHTRIPGPVRPEKFQFLKKRQNRNFDYKIVISVKNQKFIP